MSDKLQATTTRRDFLKTSATASAAVALGSVPFVHAAGDDKIKVGIIGSGNRGTGAGENVLQAAPNVEIVAIGDPFKFRVQGCRKTLMSFAQRDATTKKYGNTVNLPDDCCFAGLDCHEKVLASGANYIILASPPGFRPIHLEAAVKAGKNIFTEKPVAVDGPGTRKVLAAYQEALKKNLGIGAGTQRRHQVPYLETLQRVHNGEIGDITAMRCYWNGGGIWFRKRDELPKDEPNTDLAFHLNNWYHFVWTCGDHIVEQHVHNLDVCNWAMKNKHPVKAVGMGSRIGNSRGRPNGTPQEVGHIFDNFAIDFEYENGVHMLSMCRHIPNCDNNVSEDLVGSKGVCHTSADQKLYTINGKRLYAREQIDRHPNPYVQEHTDLINSIRSGKPINELQNVAESSLTAIMGRLAAYTGKPLTWEQVLNSKMDTMPKSLSWNMKLEVPPVAVPGKTEFI
jgi:predicted dehydrogenase